MIKPLFFKDNILYILDQRELPFKETYIKCKTYSDVIYCIKNMVIRGAPAIGIAGGYGVLLAVKEAKSNRIKNFIKKVKKLLLSTRPTAYNLFYVVDRLTKKIFESPVSSKSILYKITLKELNKIIQENRKALFKIVKEGVKLIEKNSNVLTHCNTGVLACVDYGTALGIIIEAYKKRKINLVYVDETRPLLQGARLTVYELARSKVPYCLITDNMAAYLMQNNLIDCIIVGADRIANNGDTANKIGTYNLAVLASYHKIPFYVAAPFSTIDTKISCGKEINIEFRNENELKYIRKKLITFEDAKVLNPSFDITPAELITAIITERGIYRYPYDFSRF